MRGSAGRKGQGGSRTPEEQNVMKPAGILIY